MNNVIDPQDHLNHTVEKPIPPSEPNAPADRQGSAESSAVRTINELTEQLPDVYKPAAKELISQLESRWREFEEQLAAYRSTRFELGRVLYDLHTLSAKAGCKGMFTACLGKIGIARSTAYDVMEDYNRVKGYPDVLIEAAKRGNLDITAKRYSPELQRRITAVEGMTQQEALDFIADLREKAAARRPRPTDPDEELQQDREVYRILEALIRVTSGITENQKIRRVRTAVDIWERQFVGLNPPVALALDPIQDQSVEETERRVA